MGGMSSMLVAASPTSSGTRKPAVLSIRGNCPSSVKIASGFIFLSHASNSLWNCGSSLFEKRKSGTRIAIGASCCAPEKPGSERGAPSSIAEETYALVAALAHLVESQHGVRRLSAFYKMNFRRYDAATDAHDAEPVPVKGADVRRELERRRRKWRKKNTIDPAGRQDLL